MTSVRHLLSSASGACVLLAVIFGPLAFGSVEPWAYSVLALLSFTALFFALIHDIRAGDAREAASPLLVIGALALLLVALQAIPWPAGLLALFQPRAADVHLYTAEMLGEDPPAFIVPSLYPHATRVALLKYASFLCLFVAACNYVNSRRRLNRVAAVVVGTGFVAALFGILQNLAGVSDIFWLRSVRGRQIFGPFISRNSYASYAGICFFTGIGLLLARGGYFRDFLMARTGRRGVPSGEGPSQNLLLGFAISIIGASILWSLSRGGVVSATLACAVVLFALVVGKHSNAKRLYFLAVLLVALGWVTYLGWDPVISRLSTLGIIVSDPVAIDRWRAIMWTDAWNMGRSFPLMGAGAGTFMSVYPAHSTLPAFRTAHSPHNEYLGVLAETGFTGLALLLLASGFLLFRVFKALRVREDAFTKEYLAGSVGAVFFIGFHSVVDFPFRVPGIAATLVVVCALLSKLAVLDRKRKPRKAGQASKEVSGGDAVAAGTPDRRRAKASAPSASKGSAAMSGVLLTVVFLAWVFACRAALAELNGHLEGIRIERAIRDLHPGTANADNFVKASRDSIDAHSPRNAGLYAMLASFAHRASGTVEDPIQRLVLAEKSLELHEVAARLEPLNPHHRLNMALGFLEFRRPDFAWVHGSLGVRHLPRDPFIRIELAEIFFDANLPQLAVTWLEEAESIARERELRSALRSIRRLKSRHGVGERGDGSN